MSASNIGYYGVFAKEHWERLRFQDKNSFYPEIRETTSIAIDANSIVRNSTNTVHSIIGFPAAASAFVAGSSVLGGALGVPIGLSAMRDSFVKGKAAYEANDAEGVAQNALWAACGAGYTGLSGLLAAEGVMGLSGAAVPAAFVPAFSGLGIAMSGAILGYSSFGFASATRFKNQLQRAEEGGQKTILEFLNRQISLTPEEIAGKSDAELGKSLRKKWNALERKVGVDCSNEIRRMLPHLLQNDDPEKVEKLILEVKKANFKERIKHVVLIGIALIGALAFAGLLLTTGPFSPFLFVLTAALWLLIDSSKLHNAIGEKCWAWHCKSKEAEEKPSCPVPLAS